MNTTNNDNIAHTKSNDLNIVIRTARLGYYVHSKVKNRHTNEVGTVVGIESSIYSSEDRLLVQYPKLFCGIPADPNNVHSSYHSIIDKKEIWSEKKDNIESISFTVEDQKIANNLRSYNLKVGDFVEVFGRVRGKIAGYLDGANKVIISTPNYKWAKSYYGLDVDSFYHPLFGKNDKFIFAAPSDISKLESGPELQSASLSVQKHKTVFPTLRHATKKSHVIKSELKKAGYRIVATQTLKAAHAAIVGVVENKGASSSAVQTVSDLLATEYGKALIAISLGIAIQQVPGINEPVLTANMERLAILAKEFRIAGMTVAANELIETIFKSALEAIIHNNENSEIRIGTQDDPSLDEELNKNISLVENKYFTV